MHHIFLTFALLPLAAELASPTALAAAPPPAVQEATTQSPKNAHDKAQVALRSASIEFTAGRPPLEVEASLERAATLLLPSIQDGQLAARERLLAQEVWTLREKLVARYPEAGKAHAETWAAFARAIGRTAEAESEPLATDIDEKVYAAIGRNDMTFVAQLGKRAVPGLLRFLADQPSRSYDRVSADPFSYLLDSDPIAADAFVAELRAKGGADLLWNIRFARAMEESGLFSREDVWKTQTLFGDETHVPAILDWCDDLLATPECARSVGLAMGWVVRRHVYPEGLRARTRAALASDMQVPAYIQSWLENNHPHEPLRDLMLEGLGSTNDSVASLAFGVLWRIGSNEGIYSQLIRQPTVRRRLAAQWLTERTVSQRAAPGSAGATQGVKWRPEYGAAEERLLDQLLSDSDAEVRKQTLDLLKEVPTTQYSIQIPAWPKAERAGQAVNRRRFPIAVSNETLLRLADDPSVEVRRALASFASLVPAAQRMLLARRFAGDEDQSVRLTAIPLARNFCWVEDVEAAIAATDELTTVLGRDQVSDLLFLWTGGSEFTQLDLALGSKRSFTAIAEWVLKNGSIAGASFLLRSPQSNSLRDQAAAISPAVWAKLIALSASAGQRYTLERWLEKRRDDAGRVAAIGEAAAGQVEDPETLALLLESPPSPSAERNDLVAVNAWMNLLRAKKWGESLSTDHSPFVRELAISLDRYDLSTREALSRRLVLDEATPKGLAGQVFGRMAGAVPITEEVVRVAVQTTGTEQEDPRLMGAVVTWMGDQPEAANLPWIERLAQRKDTVQAALKTIARLRDPRLLPAVAAIIEGPPTAYAYSHAVRALGGFLSDEAAELLLLAARKTPVEDDRAYCLKQLEKIAALQDAEARWAARRVSATTREATISKLLGLLSSDQPAVRVEAIRGLATWEAVEAMPTLIELLGDPNEAIAAAARAALDRLNAPTKGD